jgi:hypothetical protein
LLMIAGVVAHPEWFCWIVLIPMNLYLISMFAWQKEVTRRLDQSIDSPALRAATVAA